MDEKQAIAHLKQGEVNGLEVLVHLYQVQAVRAACMVAGDLALAEDIVQDAFIRAGARIDQFDEKRPFGPCFLRSVVNDAIKAANRQKRIISLESVDCEEAGGLIDPAPLPEERFDSAETSQAIWKAISQLSPDERAAIVLRYYLDMSETEMANELNRPAGTIKWWLFAARKRLEKLLRPFRPSRIAVSNKKQPLSEKDHDPGDHL